MLLAGAEISAVCAVIFAVLILLNRAHCRMYALAVGTWSGLAKYATESTATLVRIVPITLLLVAGQVLPLPLLWLAWMHTTFLIPFLGPPIRIGMAPVWWALAAVVLSYLPRVIYAIRYRQNWLFVVLHPVAVALLLVMQWYALLRKPIGKPAE
jgi:hypothetical protein